MGAIFPMAPLKVRLGFVRKREKAAKRAAEAKGRLLALRLSLVKLSVDAAKGRGAMSGSSLFTKNRNATLALGKTERTAVQRPLSFHAASFTNFVRLTPQQNAKLGLSP